MNRFTAMPASITPVPIPIFTSSGRLPEQRNATNAEKPGIPPTIRLTSGLTAPSLPNDIQGLPNLPYAEEPATSAGSSVFAIICHFDRNERSECSGGISSAALIRHHHPQTYTPDVISTKAAGRAERSEPPAADSPCLSSHSRFR